jgi:hypothetical protein
MGLDPYLAITGLFGLFGDYTGLYWIILDYTGLYGKWP